MLRKTVFFSDTEI